VHCVSDAKQIRIHTTEPSVSDSILFEVQFAIAKLKHYKWPGSDQILVKLIEA
jgi:hypothetical protein